MEIFMGAIPVLFICLLFLFIRTSIQNYRLQKRLSVVESTQFAHRLDIDQVKTDNLLLTKDQELWLEKNRDDIQRKISKLSDDLKKENHQLNADQEKWVAANRESFDKKLKEEFNKSCEKIKFDEIEYKKTITKKRKEFNRKNGANAKPQRQWRYIDEDDTPSMQ